MLDDMSAMRELYRLLTLIGWMLDYNYETLRDTETLSSEDLEDALNDYSEAELNLVCLRDRLRNKCLDLQFRDKDLYSDECLCRVLANIKAAVVSMRVVRDEDASNTGN